MKKKLFLVSSTLLLAHSFLAQDAATDDFDKKFRFGLRVSPQPTWVSSNNNFTTRDKGGFGFGFGLVTEFRLSEIVHFQTGIGGDFERGSVTYKNTYNFSKGEGTSAFYSLDDNGDLIESETNSSNYYASTNQEYLLQSRKVKSTYITVPLILKMMTREVDGFRYFGMFGGELGIRTALKADDKVQKLVYSGPVSNPNPNPGTPYIPTATPAENTGLNIGKDGSLVPVRFGLNVGLGTEYRLSGSTALFVNVNYFHSFTNMMRKESKYIHSDWDRNDSKPNFVNIKQELFMRAVRINLGVMF